MFMKLKEMRLIYVVILLASLANMCVAQDLCRKDAVVLEHKFRSASDSELKSLYKVINVERRTARAITGSISHKTRSSVDLICSTSINVCAKFFRDSRKVGFKDFIKTKAFACSSDFKVQNYAANKSEYKPTNDTLIKKQRYSIETLGLQRSWQISNGTSNIVVAVIDTGVDYNHPDLAQNILPGKNFVGGNSTDDPMDDNGHGSHVSGTIAAVGNNGIGVAGIAWNVKILPLKFLDANGSGYISDAVRAINYMVYAKQTLGYDIRVVNNSWGGGGYSDAVFQAISAAKDAGIVFTAAAGNEANDNDSNPSYPASYKLSNVISVAAYDSATSLAYFSNYGSKTVNIAAPGVNIASTYMAGRYAYLSGTSMATPHVSGAIALLASVYPSLTMGQLTSRVVDTAKYNSELDGYVYHSAQLNVLNMLRNRQNQNYFAMRLARKKASL